MTFLPIVERELRVAARKKGTYWARAGVGLMAMVLGGGVGLAVVFNPTVRFGTLFFQTLAGSAMLYCLGAGRFLTADCLSAEKREETMGLLFLTDLKGYDVVLGKMAATSLNGLYGLLAVLPVLALTLLSGGITSGEFWRVALVLVDTFLFSLAIGIFASALTREFRSAMALNFYLLLLLAGFFPALAGLLLFFNPSVSPDVELFLSCPIYTLVLAFDASYHSDPVQFWSSASVILSISWLLVALTCQIAPRSWQEKRAARPKNTPRQEAAFRARARAFRSRLLDQNAYYWLAARPWWKADTVWAVLGVALFWLLAMRLSIGWLDESICVMVGVTLTGAFKFWITLEAAQTLAEDVKSGAFELLLATPLAARDIVRRQTLALRRQFLKPLLVVTMLDLFFMGTLLAAPPHDRSFSGAFYFCFWVGGILMTAADVVTLSLVGMAAGLTEKNLTRALLKTVRLVLVLPWAIWAAVMAMEWMWEALFSDSGRIGRGFELSCWFAVGIGLDLLLGWTAWRRLTRNFRELALRRFGETPPRAGWRARCAKTGRAFRDNVWRHPRHRKWAMGFAALLVTGLALEVWDASRSHDPPPEVVLTGPGDGTAFQAIAASDGVFLILPDGSLWRWGHTEGTNRSLLPERVGTHGDWSKVSVNGSHRLGVRRDGTLWAWQPDGAATQIGADKDWTEAVSVESYSYNVARKKDGTLWEWGEVTPMRTSLSSPPVWLPAPAPANHHWRAHGMNFPNPRLLIPGPRQGQARIPVPGYTLAVDDDGTLWVWGTVIVNPGSGPGWPTNSVNVYAEPIQVCRETNWVGLVPGGAQNQRGDVWIPFAAPPNPADSISSVGNLVHSETPVQMGTNRDWMALDSRLNTILAVRTNGTLWGWGDFQLRAMGPFARPRITQPAQLCSETDWIGFDRSFRQLVVQNKSGQFWVPPPIAGFSITAVPSAATSISSTGALFASFSPASAASPPLKLFSAWAREEVHTNGTLWFRPVEFNGIAGSRMIRQAQRADQRTDWLAVAQTGNTTFGLTADGTVWTWGFNLGEAPTVRTRSRLQVAQMQAEMVLGIIPRMNLMGPEPSYRFQEKPRALMKLVPEKER